MQIWRYLFAASAVLFVVGVVVQIFLAGFGMPGLGGQGMQTHIDFGYTLSLAPIVPLVLSWPARAGRQTIVMCAVLLVLTFVQTLLPSAARRRECRGSQPCTRSTRSSCWGWGSRWRGARSAWRAPKRLRPRRPTSRRPSRPQA